MFAALGPSNEKWEMKERKCFEQLRKALYNCLLCRLTFCMLLQVPEKPLTQQHKKADPCMQSSPGGYSLHSATSAHGTSAQGLRMNTRTV